MGISISASLNKGKGNESGNGTTHTETLVNAGQNVNLVSGRDTTLTGAQVSAETVKADVGRNLTMTSEQDSDRYDSKQQNASAGGSFTFGSMTGSANFNLSRDKMHSNYDSVVEQTGIFAGKGGFDVTVGEHTQLNGAVIGSTASADKNRLDTGTLGFSDIHNQADYKVEHQSIGMSTGGSIGSQFAGNLANSLLAGVNKEGHDSGTTRAAVSEGALVIRDQDKQTQDVANLSRDAENANGSINQIFDKEKEQKRIQQAQLVGELTSQAMDVVHTEVAISATEKAKAQLANATAEDRQKAIDELKQKDPNATLKESDIQARIYGNLYDDAIKESGFGVGGTYSRVMDTAAMVVKGLAGGDMKAALAGGASPWIAEYIGHGNDLTAYEKLAAHAVVNAALAAAQGQNAAAGAAGAVTGELTGMIASELYGKTGGALSESQKQTVSALATLASGLAGGLAGDSTASAAYAAQAGKTTVENNYLTGDQITSWLTTYEKASTDEARKKLVDAATKADAAQQQKALNTQITKEHLTQQQDELIRLIQSPGCDAKCRDIAQYSIDQLTPVIDNYAELQRGNNIPKAAIATISLAIPVLSKAVTPAIGEWIGSQAIANRVVGAGIAGTANTASQVYNMHNDPTETFSPASLFTSVISGGISVGMKAPGTIIVSTAGAGVSSLIDGKNPLPSMLGAAGGATAGYYAGKGIEWSGNRLLNPSVNGLKDMRSSTFPSLIYPPKVNPIPGIAGAAGGSALSERAGYYIEKKATGDKK